MTQPTTHDTIVIGGGQAGLTMSYHLRERGIDHLVLERARVGERWRTERWDSLRFQFPARFLRLPGMSNDGADADAFPHRDDVVRFLERYAQTIDAPLRCGVDVRALDRDDAGTFTLATPTGELRAHRVVVATGPYQHTLRPAVSAALPSDIVQLPASAYTRAEALPDGGVLVVGAGGSGVQIAEDLLVAGRQVWLCVGRHKRIPRRYRGRDIADWFEALGVFDKPAQPEPGDHSPLLTGIDGGYEVTLERVANAGGKLLGRLEGVDGRRVLLGDRLAEDMAAAEAACADYRTGIDAFIAASGEPAPPPDPIEPISAAVQDAPRELDLDAHSIGSVIWATGYGVDLSWIRCDQFRADGMPIHDRGSSRATPGLHYLGLPFLYSARSTLFWAVGADAAHLAETITADRR